MTNARHRRFWPFLIICSGLTVAVGGLSHYLSPLTRLELYGVKLGHRAVLLHPASYLWGYQSHVESWTEHDGRLDTPLSNDTVQEVSTLQVERAQGSTAINVLSVRPQEWIRSLKNAAGFKNDTIPLNDPSIAPGTIVLDQEGTLLERRSAAAWRTERAMQMLIPQFPKGFLRRAGDWTEHLEWVETTSGWTISWQADLQWVVKNFELRYGKPCAILAYEATLRPTVLQTAAWVKSSGGPVRFTGEARGEAVFDVKDKWLISNTLSYAGLLKIHVSNLANVPEDLRVGLVMAATGGDVVLKLANKMDIRLP